MNNKIGKKISVIITTYNRRYEVKRALESVIAQKVESLEIILVDDASEDLTEPFIKSYDYPNMKYIRLEKNVGPGAARNIGIKEAHGEYIAFLDSDNEWMDNKISMFSTIIEEKPDYDIYFSKYIQHINFDTVEYPLLNGTKIEDIEKNALQCNLIDASSAIYKKCNFYKYGFFSENLKTNIEWELGLRWSRTDKIRCKFIDSALSENHPMHNSLSNNLELVEKEKRTFIEQNALEHKAILFNNRTSLLYRQYKHRIGCIMYNFCNIDIVFLNTISECLNYCEKIVLCIPDDDLVLRMTGESPQLTFDDKTKMLLALKHIYDVIPIDVNNMSKIKIASNYNIDIFFEGTEYGLFEQNENIELYKMGIKVVSLQPAKVSSIPNIEKDSLHLFLSKNAIYKKIVLFGTGKYFDYYLKNYGDLFEPSYAVDNNSKLWNTEKNGVLIKNPKILQEEDPQKTIIIICCKEYQDIKEQITQIAKFEYRVLQHSNNVSFLEEFYLSYLQENEYLENAHRILKILLKEFVRICEKYKLHYYIISGSLIGVIRHHNQIPWDDDIDIAIPREDFNKLKEIVKDEWKQNSDFMYLEYDKLGADCFYDFMSRIVYTGEKIPTQLFRRAGRNVREDILDHMVLDLYVLDDSYGGLRHYINTTLIKMIYALAMGHRDTLDFTEYDKMSVSALKVLKIVCKIGKKIPLSLLFKLYETVRNSANGKGCKFYYESCGVITYMPMLYDKKLYGEGSHMIMEDMYVRVPSDFEYLLKEKGYGIFMNFPGIYHRQPSHAPGKCKVIW